ncbi:Amino acid permease family protein [Histomonas meleagridis]|uniref:Amino acid permease family protein n=1 Tax=Histomonas meleagridis TaxID=135588 RepID=UPI003559D360|nr:Amino acid permease family protein [Histomonas meleagridis]KAH0801908.1 Amino acid permease family protein [Histomonas meleagridis]
MKSQSKEETISQDLNDQTNETDVSQSSDNSNSNFSHAKHVHIPKLTPPKQEGESHIQNTFVGVFVPCFVNIVNIVFFARLPYCVGTYNGFETFLSLAVSFVIVLVTIFSLSAYSSNGEVESGGSYHLISRTIGPETGGSTGICLTAASIFGAATAHIGIAEQIVILYYSSSFSITGSNIWDVRLISLVLSLIVGYLANFIFPSTTKADGIIGCSNSRFLTNWNYQPISVRNFFDSFSILFPAFGGILAGSNGSGALKRPQLSIPLGSITGLIAGTLVYIVTTFLLTGCHPNDQMRSSWNAVFQDSSLCGPIVFIAVAAASIAKGVTGLGTGPIVLRAMASDGLIPKWFGDYSRIFSTFVCVILCLWGDFNNISSLSSMMFLTVFAFLNEGIFLAKVSKAPSFRPHFRFYNPYISLLFCFICVAAMLFINVYTASISLLIALIFFVYTKKRHLEVNWGSLREASAYNKGLKAALNLKHVFPHPKLYRPNIVLLINGPPIEHIQTITFLDQMLSDHGMAIVVRIFPLGTSLSEINNDRGRFGIKNDQNDYHIFYETVIAENEEIALLKIMLLMGLGALRPNVVFVKFDEELKESSAKFIWDVLERQWSIILLRIGVAVDFGENTTIDLWYLSEDGGLSLLIAQIIALKAKTLRVLTFAKVDEDETVEHHTFIIKHILKKLRINAKVIVRPITNTVSPSHQSFTIWDESAKNKQNDQFSYDDEMTRHYMLIADAIRADSSGSLVTVISLPKPPPNVPGELYMRWLNLLSSFPSSVLFIRGNGTQALSWQM